MRVDFITDLGAKVSVDISGPEQLLDTQRQYGRLGWTSGAVPRGGYQFPFENRDDFDWNLLGARRWTSPDGEELIIHQGHAYRRRELEAVDSRKMKLPAAVKYSRGAKATDPPEIREQADGGFEYVTLAIFRGGKRQDRYAVPGGRPATTPPPVTVRAAQATPAQTNTPLPPPGDAPPRRPPARPAQRG